MSVVSSLAAQYEMNVRPSLSDMLVLLRVFLRMRQQKQAINRTTTTVSIFSFLTYHRRAPASVSETTYLPKAHTTARNPSKKWVSDPALLLDLLFFQTMTQSNFVSTL